MAGRNFERPGIHKSVKHFDDSTCYRGGASTQIFSAAGTGASIAHPSNTQKVPTSMQYRQQGTVSGSGENIQTGLSGPPLQGHLSARSPENGEMMQTLSHKAASVHGQSQLCAVQSKGKCMEAKNDTMHHLETTKTEKKAKEEKVQLTKPLYKLIKESKDIKLPDVRVIFEYSREGAEDTVCTLKGSPDDIEQFKSVVVDMGKRLVKTEVTFSTETTHMLHDINLEDSINMQLKDKYPCCIAEQRSNVIYLFGFDSNKISLAKRYVCRLIKESNHLLMGDLRKTSLLVQDHFNHKFKNRIVARVSNCRLYMAGLKNAIDEANAEFVEISEGRKSLCVKDTFKNKEITRELKIDDPLKFEFLAKSSLIQDVTDTFKVTIHTRLEECTFEVQGSNENVTPAVKHLLELGKYLKTDYIDTFYAKHLNYFKFGLQDIQIQFLMTKFKVLVHRNILFSCGTERVKKEPNPDTKRCIWTSPDGKLLVLDDCFTLDNVKADLTYKPVFRGPTENRRFVGKYVKDRLFVEIPFPDLIPSETSVFPTVEKIVNDAIFKAGIGKTKSVAFLVSPFGMWNDKNLMQCIVNSSVEWFLNPQKEFPSSIQLCTQNEECSSWTDEYIDRCLKIEIQGASGVKVQPDISVVKGYIDKAEVDVIINTTVASLDLTRGNVSSALLREAGDQLLTECRYKFPQGIRPNEVAVTDGYNLKCKKVFHVSLQAQARSSDVFTQEQIIRQTMLGCLKKASDNGYRSLAFPALGTGSLNFPTKRVASEMLMSIERFIEDCPSTSLREIMFVIHPSDVDVFETFSRLKEKIVPKNVDVKVQLEIVGMDKDVDRCMEFLRQTSVETSTSLHASGLTRTSQAKIQSQTKTSLPIHTANCRTYQSGNVFIRVYEADLLKVPVDCIVNAANGNLQHYSGIARAIAEGAGTLLIDECRIIVKEKGTLPVTHVVKTAAGNLHFKFIIHAVGPCFADYKPYIQSNVDKCAQDLKQTVLNCFSLADENAIRSIALPAISSGTFQVPKETCAVQYAKAVGEFGSNCHSLKEIHFVDISPDIINTIHKAFHEVIAQGRLTPFKIDHYIKHTTVDHSTEIPDKKMETVVKNTARDKPKFAKSSTPVTEQSDLLGVNAEYISEKSQTQFTFARDKEHQIKVVVQEGDIVDLTGLTAVVCGEGRTGEGKGVVARLLLEKGGEVYRQLKAQQFTCHRKYGEVITTPGGNNNYTWVMHAIISRHDQKYFTVVYRNIFEEIQGREFESVALPLIGTGVGSLDPKSSTELLVRELTQFCNTKGKGTLTLHVVINDNATVNVVKDVFKRISEGQEKVQEQLYHKNSPHEEQNASRMGNTLANSVESDAGEDCVICMDKLTNAEKLKCGHRFCKECIEGYFKVKQVCPTCGKVCGTIIGDQPDGSMEIIQRLSNVAGYENCGSISITYNFGSGIQGPDHPRPGAPFKGISRTAYLPNNSRGREVCAMLKIAFQRRLVFTIGTSRTTGKEGVITWNDIHHKTDPRPNTQFGYPDTTYLQRVREELAIKGITEQDVEQELVKDLQKEGFRQIFTSNK